MGFEHMNKFDVPVTDTDTLPTKERFYIFPDAGVSITDYAIRYCNVDIPFAALSGFIPHDFTAIISMTLVWISPWTGVYSFTVDVDYAANGEPFNNHSSTANYAPAEVNNIINETSILSGTEVFAANDYFGVKVTHTGGIPDEMWLLGVRLHYV